MKKKTVKTFIEHLQSHGRYSFEKQELLKDLDISLDGIRVALSRLGKMGRIAMICHGFYVIIPLEYRESGILPAVWFIDHLMKFLRLPYYVGLLSAASLQGASHHQPQEFQVVTVKQVRPIRVRGLTVKFIVKRNISPRDELKQLKTETGYIWVSQPELTAIDLLSYANRVGGMNHAATVLAELGEILRPARLVAVAKKEAPLAVIQRLGYILDYVGWPNKTAKLARLVHPGKAPKTLLEPGIVKRDAEFNEKWSVVVNRKIEVDEL
jgi:predicted transcriptional regulator of viral defense system